jgi:predicted nucleic acid-binding Zn ribbon protein
VSERKPGKPTRLGEVLPAVLGQEPLRARMEQAAAIVHWPAIVGPQIAKVTQALSVDRQGVLQVAVTNSAWMNELAMMEPELLRAINEKSGARKVARIRWRLVR